MKPEPSELTRRGEGVWSFCPFCPCLALPAPVLEEFLEELLKRRTRRQLWHGAAASQIDRLLGGNVDHGVNDLFGHVGNALRPARRGRDQKAGQAMAAAVKRAKPARPTGFIKRKKVRPWASCLLRIRFL